MNKNKNKTKFKREETHLFTWQHQSFLMKNIKKVSEDEFRLILIYIF